MVILLVILSDKVWLGFSECAILFSELQFPTILLVPAWDGKLKLISRVNLRTLLIHSTTITLVKQPIIDNAFKIKDSG